MVSNDTWEGELQVQAVTSGARLDGARCRRADRRWLEPIQYGANGEFDSRNAFACRVNDA
jgi:hypothetical protein